MRAPSAADLLKAPALRFFLIYATLFGLVLLYGRRYFYRDPGSVFFDKHRAFEEYYTQYRRNEARQTLEQYGWAPNGATPATLPNTDFPSNITKASTNPTICASFLTVRRPGEQYIEQAIGSALAGLAPEERQQVHLGVFFANTNPDVHPTYKAPWLRPLIDTVYSYDLDPETFRNVTRFEEEKDWHTKSVFDYTYAMEWCYATGAPYTLLLEGDIILADSWLVQTIAAVKGIQDKLHLSTADWLYLRLFNQERSTGWAGRRVGDNNEFLIIFGVCAVVLGVALVARRTKASRMHLDNPTLIVLCMVIVPSAVILFFQAGKASLLPPRPGLVAENFGCCSQALLYPREQIPSLVESLRDEGSGQYDLMINNHARHNDLKRITHYPILVQHIGIESTATTSAKDDARAVWSTAFENLKPEKLRDQHKALLKDILNVELD